MTQDEIIEMARQSGFMPAHDKRVQHFAKLVAAKERKRLVDELQKMPLNDTANSIAIWIRGQE